MAAGASELIGQGELQTVRQTLRDAFSAKAIAANPDLKPFIGRDRELQAQADALISLWGTLLSSSPKGVILSNGDMSTDRGAVLTRGVLRPRFDLKTPDGGRAQLYVEEIAPAVEKNASTPSIVSSLMAKRESILAQWANLSSRKTETAVEEKQSFIRALGKTAEIPVEKLTVTLQSWRQTHRPLLGIQVLRTLDGYAAHPVVYSGDVKSLISTVDLLPGEIQPIAGAPSGYESPFPVMKPEQYHGTPLGRMSEALIDLLARRLS